MKRYLRAPLSLAIVLLLLAQPRTLAQPSAPADPRAVVQQLERERGDLDVRTDPATGAPVYLHGQLADSAQRDPQAAAYDFFRRYGVAWGIGAPEQSLRLVSQQRDALGYTSLRFEQRAAGFVVFDTDLRVQIDPDGALSTINGQLQPDLQPPALRPQLDQAAAQRRALQRHPGSVVQRPAQLGIVRTAPAQDRLAWELWLSDSRQPARWQIRIDALDGALISERNTLDFARDRRTFDSQGSTVLPGTLVRQEQQPLVADAVVNAVHDNTGRVYDYYHTTFGRDSLDGNGMPIVSTVHYGQQINNAYWDGDQMIYGDGDGERFAPLGGALDVVAHELTHGVTDYTAGLSYQGESGALNESFSDIFAMLIDDANWEIAETVYTPAIPGDALRSAADPTRYADPSVWGEFLRTNLDNGGIHSNSGIYNKIAYEIGVTIGRPKTAAIFYRTLTAKLTALSDLVVARNLTIQACDELIGSRGITDHDCADVRMAFTRSGLGLPSHITRLTPLANQTFLPIALERDSGLASRLAPPPIPDCGGELVRNGGFEDGLSGWASDDSDQLTTAGNPVVSGSGSAKLSATYQLLDYVRLPADAQTATVRFNLRRADTVDPAQQTLEVRAESNDGATLATLATLTGAQPSNTWLSYSATLDVSGLPDLRLVFRDRYGAHYIDDVSIVAACPATSAPPSD